MPTVAMSRTQAIATAYSKAAVQPLRTVFFYFLELYTIGLLSKKKRPFVLILGSVPIFPKTLFPEVLFRSRMTGACPVAADSVKIYLMFVCK